MKKMRSAAQAGRGWSNSRAEISVLEQFCEKISSYICIYASKFLPHYFHAQQFPLARSLRSIDALPLLQQKLESRQLNAGSQLAHVCNRFFSVLESKGILRTATEEFLLASKYSPHDELSAEFIRTFRERRFMGMSYLQRYELVLKWAAP